ncbi:MAG: hypothetical protein SPL65_10890, partial [Lachnospiraceae bacterium]|nr:hypothetical protein [Lachnospiraceae bacterium]
LKSLSSLLYTGLFDGSEERGKLTMLDRLRSQLKSTIFLLTKSPENYSLGKNRSLIFEKVRSV